MARVSPKRMMARLDAMAAAGARAAALGLCLAAAATAARADAPAAAGDMSIDYIATQPASMVTCSYGYWAEKKGDHKTANAIFDRCIEAGYVGAMIWKALLLEEGNGVPRDLEKAAALLHRAATSGDAGYAAIAKLHYATDLYLGRGVPQDKVEAMKWFRAAAAEGDPDAQAFLRTGHHTADRDMQGNGVGAVAEQARGMRLERVAPSSAPSLGSAAARLLVLLLGAVFASGLLVQAMKARRPSAR